MTVKANAICAQLRAKFAAINSTPRATFVQLAPQLASYQTRASAEMSDLVPPTAVAHDWQQITSYTQTLANNIAKLGEYEQAKELPAARAVLFASRKVDDQLIAIARSDGFVECARIS